MYKPVRRALLLLAMSAAAAVSAQAQLAGSTVTSSAKNGFSGGTSICKQASASRTVSNGGELVDPDWVAGGCVGYFSVNFSNTGFTLTVLEGGNYSYSNLNMLFTGGPSITGASFLGYSGSFFDPTYGMNESNLLPTVTFTGNSIDVLWNTNDDSQATQFRFSDQGVGVGTASFAYATSSTVPEPSSIALLAAGLMGIVLARQRRANV